MSDNRFKTVWALDRTVSVPAHGSYSVTVETPTPVERLGIKGIVIPKGGALPDGYSGYRAARRKDGSGGPVANLAMQVVPLRVEENRPTIAHISVHNPNGYEAWLVSPNDAGYPHSSDGQPSLHLTAR